MNMRLWTDRKQSIKLNYFLWIFSGSFAFIFCGYNFTKSFTVVSPKELFLMCFNQALVIPHDMIRDAIFENILGLIKSRNDRYVMQPACVFTLRIV